MIEQRIVKELNCIISLFDEDWLDEIIKSPFAKDHLKVFIENVLCKLVNLCERIDYDIIITKQEKEQKAKDNNNSIEKYNKVRCLILNFDKKLKDNQIIFPYDISTNISEIVQLVKD